MKIIVDTCVWSTALRKKNTHEDPFVLELSELIREYKVQLLGPIRQEILSGIPSHQQFRKLRQYLSAFPDIELKSDDYERAAELFNLNRSKGIQGSNTDFLICAVSEHYGMPILTSDKDFTHFRKHSPFKLHLPRNLAR